MTFAKVSSRVHLSFAMLSVQCTGFTQFALGVVALIANAIALHCSGCSMDSEACSESLALNWKSPAHVL